MTVFDATCVAVNVRNAGAALEGDHASGVGTLNVADVYDFPATGQVSLNGDVYDYTAVDDEADTITLSGVTTAAYEDGTPVWVYPLAPVRYATVMIGSDQGGQNALVPHHLLALLEEQMQDTPDGFPVRVEPVSVGRMGWQVVDAPGQRPTFQAGDVDFILSTVEPLAQVFYDPTTTVTDVAMDDDYLWVLYADGTAEHIDPLTGEQVGTFIPLASGVAIESIGTHLFVATATQLRKWTTAGSEVVTGGWPLALAGIKDLCYDGTNILLSTATQIRKIDPSTAAETTGGGWPISAGPVTSLSADATDLVAYDVTAFRKFAISNGVEDTSGDWPLTPTVTPGYVAVGPSSRVITGDTGGVLSEHTMDATGVGSWEAADALAGRMAAGPDRFAYIGSHAVYLSTYLGQKSTAVSLDADTGAVVAHDLTVLGPSRFRGRVEMFDVEVEDINGYAIAGAWTTYTPTWSSTGTAPALGNGTLTGRYQRIGNTVHFSIEFVAGSTTTFGTGTYTFTLPFEMASTQRLTFSGTLLDASASAVYPIWGMRFSSTAIQAILDGTTAGGNARSLTNAVPVTVAQSDVLAVSGTYEAA